MKNLTVRRGMGYSAVIEGPKSEEVAYMIDWDGNKSEERLALAKKFAASPEMYEALEKLEAMYFDFGRSHFDLVEIRSIIETALKNARD